MCSTLHLVEIRGFSFVTSVIQNWNTIFEHVKNFWSFRPDEQVTDTAFLAA